MTNNGHPAVSCQNISKSFSRRSSPVEALRNVSLDLQAGEFVAIRGKSGCGKSTLMLCLGGLQKPDSGTVSIGSESIYGLPPDQRAKCRAQNIGYVFQQFHLIPYLSVRENVMAARLGLPTSNGDSSSRATELIEQVGLSDRSDHKPAELSIGECQRVALARALMNGPQVILADEPTGNLDDENTANVMQSLRQIAESGTAVLVVTHDAQCEPYVDRTIHMEAGSIR